MPVFNDSENKVFTVLPDGDYVFKVIKFECGISNGGKTSGCDKYDLELEIEGQNGAIVSETLLDHPSCAWKIDTFIKSAGVKFHSKGEIYEFRKDVAESKGIRWVNPMGLRGWCHLSTETFQKKSDAPGKPTGKANRVAPFYTDKPKLEPDIALQEQGEGEVPF